MKKSNKKIQDRLAAYGAAAAVIAGAGTGTAEASISFYDNGGGGWTAPAGTDLYFSSNGSVGTGGGEIKLRNAFSVNTKVMSSHGSRKAVPQSSNVGTTRLSAGELIGPAAYFVATFMPFTNNGIGSNGFAPGSRGYLGLKFDNGGAVNYGWADISLSAYGPAQTLTLNAFAVEGTAGLPISAGVVPEPTTLSLLALGAAGLAAFRRRKAG